MRPALFLVLALSALALLACSDTTGPEDFASVKIINETSQTFSEFYYWSCDTEDTGPNRLGAFIQPGGTRTFDNIKPGCYNLWVLSVFGGEAQRTEDLKKNTVYEWTITE
jgi:hypothetical protein